MRSPVILVAALLGGTVPASAQVTVDLHALEPLPAANPAPVRPAQHPPIRRRVTVPPAIPRSPAPTASVAVPASSGLPPAGLPSASPPPVAVQAAPAIPASLAAPPPLPSSPPLAPPAPPAAPPPEPVPPAAARVRIPFSGDQTELGPDGAAAIKGLTGTTSAGFSVLAYAAGSPDDPSTARRLSLARALAVRGALLANGVPSSRITVRALGSQSADGPADRVDINVLAGAPAARP